MGGRETVARVAAPGERSGSRVAYRGRGSSDTSNSSSRGNCAKNKTHNNNNNNNLKSGRTSFSSHSQTHFNSTAFTLNSAASQAKNSVAAETTLIYLN